ncbi:LPXTG cell wall anchor domain-containing protein [Oscillospiraceae bacterium CLA-AA-H272]|jgi:LPXTG-motif cell wall-anchored protein|uniref:LPXTG cell wall anchor domain-containing protein n=1 Tax=Brotocaccenecus cirricatena TaxID=3064195 RepID=A0AAE3DF66_9FIRM|nr:LPXTG cell wall anchor domain-containing protein [Brotocaccenecus cirricatena]MCC2128959.1 LPXTG cell wall anchor domain-containing protein [Brotocaccenecus cirricatena]
MNKNLLLLAAGLALIAAVVLFVKKRGATGK